MSDDDAPDFTIVNDMDEITPGLWVGSIRAVSNIEALRKHNIRSVLSAMRGKVSVSKTFTHFQIQLDDTEYSDALAFFPQCIAFIENELEAGRSVLVHCMAGMSRSATICCAYLMYAQQIDAQTALDMLVKARPCTMPNDGFLAQLDIFYQASYKVSKRNKVMRMYYLERALDEIMQGGGALPEKTMFPSFPHASPDSESTPPTPGSHTPRRRIRCRNCRTELAAREHMLDHGQVGPPTPATPAKGSLSPAVSRRPSTTAREGSRPFAGFPGLGMTPISAGSATPISTVERVAGTPPPLTASVAERSGPPLISPLQAVTRTQPSSRRNSSNVMTMDRMAWATLNGEPVQVARRLSTGPSGKPIMDINQLKELASRGGSRTVSRTASMSAGAGARRPSGLSTVAMVKSEPAQRPILEGTLFDDRNESAIADDDSDEDEIVLPKTRTKANVEMDVDPAPSSFENRNSNPNGEGNGQPAETTTPSINKPPGYLSASELTARLNSDPRLAALRSPGTVPISSMTPVANLSRQGPTSSASYHQSMADQTASQSQNLSSLSHSSLQPIHSSSLFARKAQSFPPAEPPPPLITNPACSGYFLEPMTWMNSFLSEGEMGGKIICPNEKCQAKLGNYDWAGVKCACREWVVPGFCIARAKVDEVVVNQ